MPTEKISNGTKGGPRPGSGRKKGVPNKRTAEIQKAVEESGLTPLQYLLNVMRDPASEPKERQACAIAAAPYVHSKLSSIEMTADMRVTRPQELSDDELAAIATNGSR